MVNALGESGALFVAVFIFLIGSGLLNTLLSKHLINNFGTFFDLKSH
jgi:hypothetical protein